MGLGSTIVKIQTLSRAFKTYRLAFESFSIFRFKMIFQGLGSTPEPRLKAVFCTVVKAMDLNYVHSYKCGGKSKFTRL